MPIVPTTLRLVTAYVAIPHIAHLYYSLFQVSVPTVRKPQVAAFKCIIASGYLVNLLQYASKMTVVVCVI